MGQQQLLLLVLGIVLVGVAVVVGIDAFSNNRIKANADALVSEALRMASEVQAWAIKPPLVGGRGDNETLAQVTLEDLGLPNSGEVYYGLDGEFTLSTTMAEGCERPRIPSGNTPLIYVIAANADTGNTICVAIAGTTAGDIGTSTRYGSGIIP